MNYFVEKELSEEDIQKLYEEGQEALSKLLPSDISDKLHLLYNPVDPHIPLEPLTFPANDKATRTQVLLLFIDTSIIKTIF